jgi:tetratricopeptide (TPR) repeat protein
MLHFGRAIGDAPESRYPIERLASIALDTASGPALDTRLASAAVRALERAAVDTSANLELVEALAALLLRLGRPQEAERRMNAAIAAAPSRARPYSFLAQALRAQGKMDGALAAVQAGVAASGPDPQLSIERGMVLAAVGDLAGAASAWREALDRDPMNPAAFGRLAGLALRARDPAVAQVLVDSALALANAPVEVLRNAIRLAVGTEPEGLSRAARLLRLGERVLEQAPNDAGALVLIARAQLVLGDRAAARARIDQVDRLSTKSAAAAEAQAIRLAIDEPRAELEVQSALRAARAAAADHLGDVSARARRLAQEHGSWLAWLAAAIAEKRRSRWGAARGALEMALELAPGAAPLHLELAEVLLELDDPEGAVARTQSAMALDGPTPEALLLLGRALGESGRTSEAMEAARGGLAMQPEDPRLKDLVRTLQSPDQRRVWLRNLGRRMRSWLAS